MQREFRQVDVFSAESFLGNPVAVVHAADGLGDDDMLRFARWTNLSETTFLLDPADPRADYRLRIFTPGGELPFAGHPTLGSAHAWLEAGGRPAAPEQIVQECGIGLVTLRRLPGPGRNSQNSQDSQGSPDQLAFQAPPLIRSGPVEEALLDEVAASLGIPAGDIVDAQWADNGPGWIAVELASADAVLALAPGPLAHDVGVVGPHPPGSPEAFEVRAFTPLIGGAGEDPVTGSLNASLALWLLATGKATAPYTARQGTALGRRGRVRVTTGTDGSVWVGGATRTLIAGRVEL